jgi:hypothetical protein
MFNVHGFNDVKQTEIHRAEMFSVHGFSDVRQTGIHTAELLVLEKRAFEFEMAIEKIKRHKSPGIDQILAELIKAVDRTIRSEIHKLINCIYNKEKLPGVEEADHCIYL